MYKILKDAEEEGNLRRKVTRAILYERVRRLASFLSRQRIRIRPATENELEVILFLLPLVGLLLKPRVLQEGKTRKGFNPHLETIKETLEELEEVGVVDYAVEEWITLYEYLPTEKRHAMYAAV